MTTIADALKSTIDTNYGGTGAGGDKPDNIINVLDVMEDPPAIDISQEYVIIYQPSTIPERVNDEYENRITRCLIHVVTPTGDDRLDTVSDEVARVLRNHTISGVNRQFVTNKTDISNRFNSVFAMELEVTMRADMVAASIIYGESATTASNITIESLTFTTGGATVDIIRDEDDMTSDDVAALATQQSIKAYVDARVGGKDTLVEMDDVSLSDPDADRIVFWDDSDGQFEFLVANTLLSISGNNLNVDESSISHDNIADVSTSDHHVKYALTEDLAAGEITQIQNINAVTISNGQWEYLGALDQSLTQSASPTFADVTVDNLITGGNVDGVDISAWLDQSVKQAASPTFDDLSLTGEITFNNDIYVLNANGQLRVTPDMTDKPVSVRFYPSGTAEAATIYACNDSNLNNTGMVYLQINGTTANIGSFAAGTGTAPTTLNINDTDWNTINIGDASCSIAMAENAISATQWGYLGALDQSLATDQSPTFSDLNLTGGDINLSNGTSNQLNFGTNGVTGPTSDAGWKLKLYEGTGLTDTYGLGIDSLTMWMNTKTDFKIYASGTEQLHYRGVQDEWEFSADITFTGAQTVDGVDISTIIGGVTEAEMNQIENIGAETISNTQWGYLGALDQALTRASSPTFGGTLKIASTADGKLELHATDVGGTGGTPEGGWNYIEFYDMDGDRQGYVGIDNNGNFQFRSEVAGAEVEIESDLDMRSNDIVGVGNVDGVDVSVLKTDHDSLQTDVDGFPDELKSLVTAEIQQLENIGAETISAAQWGYLGELDQALTQAASPTFADLTLTGDLTVSGGDATFGSYVSIITGEALEMLDYKGDADSKGRMYYSKSETGFRFWARVDDVYVDKPLYAYDSSAYQPVLFDNFPDQITLDAGIVVDATTFDGNVLLNTTGLRINIGGKYIQYCEDGLTSTYRYGLDMGSLEADVVSLRNRAANGVVKIYANTSTAGSGGETLSATFADDGVTIADKLTAGGGGFDVDSSGNISDCGTITMHGRLTNTATTWTVYVAGSEDAIILDYDETDDNAGSCDPCGVSVYDLYYIDATAHSTKRDKVNIREADSEALASALDGVKLKNFSHVKTPEEEEVGFIAEDMPEFIQSRNKDGVVQGYRINPLLASMYAKILRLEEEIESLKASAS